MAVNIQSEDATLIRQLIPLNTIPASTFAVLCEQMTVEEADAGTFLFKQGDTQPDLVYLLSGKIILQAELMKIEMIEGGKETARFALAHQIPRKIDAVANTKVRFLRLDPELLKSAQVVQITDYKEDNSYMVSDELEENDDNWMNAVLNSPIFRILPPANLQRILMTLEEVSFKPGEVIIEQGSEGDYYYIIKKGQCAITRKPTPNAKEIKLGQLNYPDTFGEDALLSGEPRNVSITAIGDVSVLRLSKDNFINLIKKPSLKYIPYNEAQEKIAEGAVLMDVREPDVYKIDHLDNSINVPFFTLRMQMKTLDKQKPVIVVCDDSRMSNSAAFTLMKHKFTAFILEGGLKSIKREKPAPESIAPAESLARAMEESASAIQPIQESTLQATATEIGAAGEEDLQALVLQLQERCKALETQKTEVENKYRALIKQTEKLKNAFDSLKNSVTAGGKQ